ncbi:hypothetical protein MMC14_009409 [Varicellaria rhodocarpa]|nr:hypothetical protein [Varicellaria rhodocarpa]
MLQESLDALIKTFTLIERRINNGIVFDCEAVNRVTESLVDCAGSIDRLKEKLDKLRCTKPAIMSVQFKRSLYPFHTKTLEKLQRTVNALLSKLGLALQALNIDASAMILEKLTMIDGKIALQTADLKAYSSDITESLAELRSHQQQTYREALDKESMEAIAWLSSLNFRIK